MVMHQQWMCQERACIAASTQACLRLYLKLCRSADGAEQQQSNHILNNVLVDTAM